MGNGLLHRLVQCEDLFAREAQYHPSCHNAFKLQHVSHCRPIKAEAAMCECDTEQQRKVAAHLKAFNIVLDFIQHRVAEQNEVVELSSFWLLHIQELESTDSQTQITEVRSWRIDSRIMRYTASLHSLRSIQITKDLFPLILYTPVSLSQIPVTDAYKLGSKDKYEDVALLLHGLIQQASCESRPLPWPLPLKILRCTHWMMSFLLTWLNSWVPSSLVILTWTGLRRPGCPMYNLSNS